MQNSNVKTENNREYLQTLFPNETVTASGTQAKVHVKDLVNKTEALSVLESSNDVLIKRSGKGITIIISEGKSLEHK